MNTSVLIFMKAHTMLYGWTGLRYKQKSQPQGESVLMKCEATTNPTMFWDKDLVDFPQCKRGATVKIDDVPMCLQHAGIVAVQKLIHSGQAEVLRKHAVRSSCNLDRWRSHVEIK